MQHFPVLVLVSPQYNFEILRAKMLLIRKIAKEKEQQSNDKSAENESSGSVNIQGIDLKQMFHVIFFIFFFIMFRII